jgi:hypothetical protein
LRTALQFEIRTGLKVGPGSAYGIIKSEFGFKGSKKRVLHQMDRLIATTQAQKEPKKEQ